VIGGDFTSRLNMNLREDKHWSYGARSSATSSVGQRPWMASAPVQIDKTGPALAEMRKEIAAFADGSKPATAAEVNRIRNIQTLSLPGAYETASAVARPSVRSCSSSARTTMCCVARPRSRR
jgi:predicted Zn-dependent peptidase